MALNYLLQHHCLCCRYSLELRVAPGCAAAAKQLVARCCPAAQLLPDHWQVQGAAAAAAEAAEGAGSAAALLAGAGSSGGAGAAAAVAMQHLGFTIPQRQADLPALFEALEGGR